MDNIEEIRHTLQETMSFMGALASGIEAAVGDPANSISYLAGKNLGTRFAQPVPRTGDIEKALAEVRSVLEKNDCLWQFETFQPKNTPTLIRQTEEGDEVMLVFRDCMIRQSLFRFGHVQKGSLCNMMYGFFAGALQTIMECESKLEILHAGENACYKRLIICRK